MEAIESDFARWLTAEINKRQWTKAQAAAAFQVSRQTLHRWQTGGGRPSVLSMMTIAGVVAHHRGCLVMTVYLEMMDHIVDKDTTFGSIPF